MTVILLSVIAVLLTTQDQAAEVPTADAVVTRHVAARGGAEAWTDVTTYSRTQATLVNVASTWRRPATGRREGLRVDQSSAEFDHYEVRRFDGLLGTLESSREKRNLSADEVQELREDAAVSVELLAQKDLGIRIEGLDRTLLRGRPVWRLNALLPSGRRLTLFLDVETSLETARRVTVSAPDGSAMELTTRFADYRPVGKLLLPHSVNGAPATYRLNPELTADFFSR